MVGGDFYLKDHDKARRLKAKGEEQGRSSFRELMQLAV